MSPRKQKNLLKGIRRGPTEANLFPPLIVIIHNIHHPFQCTKHRPPTPKPTVCLFHHLLPLFLFLPFASLSLSLSLFTDFFFFCRKSIQASDHDRVTKVGYFSSFLFHVFLVINFCLFSTFRYRKGIYKVLGLIMSLKSMPASDSISGTFI